MARALHRGIVPQTCGVGVLGIFRHNGMVHGDPLKTVPPYGGAGWEIASFTNEFNFRKEYEEAYKELKARWKVVYQSPVRINHRTGRQFFFCIYDTRQKGDGGA